MKPGRALVPILAAFAAVALVASVATGDDGKKNNKTFQYAVGLWGDMPYSTRRPTRRAEPDRGHEQPDIEFSVHDGDLKAGSATAGSTPRPPAADALYAQALGYLNSLGKPAIFTPGDNDGPTATGPRTAGLTRSSGSTTNAASSSARLTRSGKHTMKQEAQTTPTCLGVSGARRPCVENRRWTFKN